MNIIHLLSFQEVRYQGKKGRPARKRQSLSDLETKRRNVANIPLTKPDRVFDKVDIGDKKQKLKTLENQPNKVSETFWVSLAFSLCF